MLKVSQDTGHASEARNRRRAVKKFSESSAFRDEAKTVSPND
jgi:hypothetical protein